MDTFAPKHNLLLVSIGKSWDKGSVGKLSLRDATRYVWRLNERRAYDVELVLGCFKGVVKSVFVPTSGWTRLPDRQAKKIFLGLNAPI